MRKLSTLKPGERFRLPLTGKTGTLVLLTRSSATVKYDGQAGVTRTYTVRPDLTDPSTHKEITRTEEPRTTSISPGTEVEVL